MQSRQLVLLGLLALVAVNSSAFRLRANTPPSAKAQEVTKLVTHFEGVKVGLEKIVKGPHMEKLKPSLTAFSDELDSILKECKTNKKLTDDQKLEKLHNAQKGVEDLMTGLAAQQMQLKKEGDQEKESLLMGVLMTHQAAPMKEQIEIIQDDDFKNLDCSKALIAKHDEKVPLFKQVAAYLDKNDPSPSSEKTTAKAAEKVEEKPLTAEEKKAAAAESLKQVVGMLQANLDRMEEHIKQEEALHKKHNAAMEKALKSRLSNATFAKDKGKVEHLKKVFAATERKEDRKFKRHHALAVEDAKSVKASIEAIKKGDVTAVGKAMKALKDSLQARQAEMGNFLHFLQTSVTSFREKVSGDVFLQLEDCPYCAAQCLEKCHNNGHSYVDCMTECKDAGKR